MVGLDDIVVEVNVTPDRGYCFSVRGIARELSHSLGGAFRDPAPRSCRRRRRRAARTRSTCATPSAATGSPPVAVRGVDPAAPTPAVDEARLAVAGIRSISLAVDITNYLMIEIGQPMHAWDLDRLTGPLVVRRAAAGEKLTTLDGVERTLDPQDIVIADDTGVGRRSPPSWAAAPPRSRRPLSTCCSRPRTGTRCRWPAPSAGTSCPARPASATSVASTRRSPPAAAGGRRRCSSSTAAAPSTRGSPTSTRSCRRRRSAWPSTRPSRTGRHGLPAGAGRRGCSTEIGCAVDRSEDGGVAVVTPPSWRPDLTDPADLVEEVMRLDGYDQVPSVLPIAPPGSGLTATQRRRRTSAGPSPTPGYVETLSYPFVGAGDPRRARPARRRPAPAAVRLVNPLSDEEPLLRTTLLPPLLGALRRNLGRGLRDLALFELGPVFLPGGPVRRRAARRASTRRPSDEELRAAEALLPHQPWHVAAVLAGDASRPAGGAPGRPADWADAVDAARIAADAAGVTPPTASRPAPPRSRRGTRAAARRCWSDDTVVGHAGELHPAVCADLDLPRRTVRDGVRPRRAAAPRRLDRAAALEFPTALIDVALVVDAATPAADVAVGAGRGRRRAAGVGAAVRRVRGRAAGRGPQVPGVQADVPRRGPDAHRRGGPGGPRRRRRRRRRPVRCDPARRVHRTVECGRSHRTDAAARTDSHAHGARCRGHRQISDREPFPQAEKLWEGRFTLSGSGTRPPGVVPSRRRAILRRVTWREVIPKARPAPSAGFDLGSPGGAARVRR